MGVVLVIEFLGCFAPFQRIKVGQRNQCCPTRYSRSCVDSEYKIQAITCSALYCYTIGLSITKLVKMSRKPWWFGSAHIKKIKFAISHDYTTRFISLAMDLLVCLKSPINNGLILPKIYIIVTMYVHYKYMYLVEMSLCHVVIAPKNLIRKHLVG